MEFMLKLTQQDLNILSIALGEMPYKIAAQLIAKINSQISEQEAGLRQNKEQEVDNG